MSGDYRRHIAGRYATIASTVRLLLLDIQLGLSMSGNSTLERVGGFEDREAVGVAPLEVDI